MISLVPTKKHWTVLVRKSTLFAPTPLMVIATEKQMVVISGFGFEAIVNGSLVDM